MLTFLNRGDGANQKVQRWNYLCQAALAANDFLFVR
jgi:hypothetical protein